ncbi:hypothetical protein DFJ74DRAFT_346851 [Hyaloraphidium curvatum]|nr:hypothetical protein DFJ74DRAFT_346851 [Hyaloraphidium curvatum]
MGKGGKRKADPNKAFQKKKQKVGGPKGPRPNETNTSFTARTVLVPTQNLTTASDDEEENGLQVADLVARCHHHKGAAKRDAVVALHKHVVGNADVVARELGAIVEGLAPLVVDDDAEVRKAVCSFQEALLETLPRDTVRAISKLLIMYVVSAMTHIDEDIRVDALASVRMWLESNLFDDVELREKMFQNLVAMMSKDAKTSHGASLNSRMLSPKSQLEALVCFRLSLESSSTPVLLNGQRRSGVRKWPVTEGQVCQVPTADDLYKIGNDNSSRGTLASKIDKSLAESVWSFLIDCWIESLPEAMNPSIPKGAIRYNILVEILKVMDRLWRLAFASGADGEAVQTRLWTAVNKHVASVFPVGSKSATKDQTLFRDLNFAFCELAGSFSESLAGPEVEQAFLSAANFLKRSLAAEVTGWTSVTATARNLMGVLEKAIGLVDLEVAQSLLEPFITAQREIHYSTPARLESTRFLGNLFHAFAARHGYAAAFGAFRAWILSLPELLWQMRSSNSHDSFAAIVDVFGRVISSLPSKEGFADADLTAALDKAFTPLFTVNVPKKGVILGPFVRQPDDVQRTLIAIAFCHGLPQDKVCRALVYCCNIPTVSLSTVDFALDLLEAAVEDDNAAMPTYLGALLSLLVGYFSADLRALSEGNAVLDVDVGLREKVQSWEASLEVLFFATSSLTDRKRSQSYREAATKLPLLGTMRTRASRP